MTQLALAMPAEQYRAWLAYASIEPFGELQADLRAGTIARVVAEPNRDRSAHPAPFTVLDFIPWIMTEERLAERETMREAVRDDPEAYRVYGEGEEWPVASPEQRLAADRRALVLAGVPEAEIDALLDSSRPDEEGSH